MDHSGTDGRRLLDCLATSEVVAVRFATIPQRLLIDLRTSDLDGPMIKVVEPANSASERLKSFKKLRPRFKLPRKVSGVWWPGRVRSLVDSGIGDELAGRMAEVGGMPAARCAQAAFDELLLLERREIYNAVRGQRYGTLWERS
jgi:hypothetical protein